MASSDHSDGSTDSNTVVFVPETNVAASKTDIVSYHKPIPRYGHATRIIGDRMYLWCGGQNVVPIAHNGRQKESFAANIESLNLKSGKWEHRETRGYSPGGVQYYAVTAVDKTLYYFGGHCGHSGCYYSNLTKLDTTIYKWDDVRIKNLLDGPIEKYSCGMTNFKCGDDNYLFIFGGYGKLDDDTTRQRGAVYAEVQGSSKSCRTNEQHIFNLKNGRWISPVVSGDCPPPSSNFSLTAVNGNRAVLFGGNLGGSKSNLVYIAQLTKDSVHWTKISPESSTGSEWPSARADHASEYITSHPLRQQTPLVVVTGGINNTGDVLNEMWLFAVDHGTWSKVEVPSTVVSRVLHSVSIINIGAEYVWLILFGGIVSWKKGKSSRDQELVNTTNTVEIGWNPIENVWKYCSTIPAESFASNYTSTLKDRLAKRKSMSY